MPTPRAYRVTLRLVSLSLLITILAGCSRTPPALRIGANPWPGYEFLYLAQERGLFAAEGVNVEIVDFGSLSDVSRAFVHDQIDGMASSLVEVLTARDQSDREPEVVLVADYTQGADAIVARAGIRRVEDLRGRAVAGEADSLAFLLLITALERHGMTLSDVDFVAIDPADAADMLVGGEVDAVVVSPPHDAGLDRHGSLVTLFSSADVPREFVHVVSIDAAVQRARPDDVAALRRGFARAQEYAEAHPDDAWAVMSAREGLTPETLRQIVREGIQLVRAEEQPMFLGSTGILPTLLARRGQTLFEIGVLEHRPRAPGVPLATAPTGRAG